jgi:hypothetical protein
MWPPTHAYNKIGKRNSLGLCPACGQKECQCKRKAANPVPEKVRKEYFDKFRKKKALQSYLDWKSKK